MTDATHDQPDELLAELERLRTNNRKLLDELKTAKAKASASADELEAARTELLEHKLHKPVAQVLESVLVGTRFAKAELCEQFSFALNDAGQVQMLDAEGKPVEVGEGEGRHPVSLDVEEIRQFLKDRGGFDHILRGNQSSGGNAPGSSVPASPTKAVRRDPDAPAFGLR